jgi:hypothetical protein
VGAGASAAKPGAASAAATASGGAAAAEAKTKGQALLAKAVEGIGGAAALDGLTSYVAQGEVTVKTPNGEMALQTKETLVPPSRARQDLTIPGMGNMAIVMAGTEGFMVAPQGEQPMPPSMRQQVEDQMAHTPLLLLRHRAAAGFEVAAAGEGKAGDAATALLTVTFKGRTTTFGLDPQSGRVLSAAFKGAGPDGVPGDMVNTFSDFRPAGNLTLPYKQASTLNGEPIATGTLATITINGPVDDALWKRKGATP